MFLCKQTFLHLFSVFSIAVSIGTLSACLDIPSDYTNGQSLESAKIILIRDNGDTSSHMQVPASENFKLAVKILPKDLENDLTISWYANNKEISKQKTYAYKKGSIIPDSVNISDEAENSIGYKFTVLQNTPPEFIELVKPANEDTILNYANAVIQFEWIATDIDNDSLTYFLKLDGIAYPTGHANSIYQGGIPFGMHEFQIIVLDNFNNSDTSKTFVFYLKDKEEK